MKLNLPLALRNALISATLLSSASTIYAGDMNGQLGYQLYRDLAENLNGFSPGATNVKVYDIDGNYVGNIPIMPDFSAFSGPSSQYSLAGGQSWLADCWHNGYKDSYTFSKIQGTGGTPVAEYYEAVKRVTPVDQDTYIHNYDISIARSNKVVTDAIHWELATDDKYIKDLATLSEAQVWRLGSGTQIVYEPGNNDGEWQVGAYATVTAGTVLIDQVTSYTAEAINGRGESTLVEYTRKHMGNLADGNETNNFIPISTNSGDSGSPTIVYNEDTNSWQLTSLLFGVVVGEPWTGERPYGHYSDDFFNYVIDSSAHFFDTSKSAWTFGAADENGLVNIDNGTSTVRALKQGERGATSTVGTAASDAEMWLALDWVFAADQATTLSFDGNLDTGAGSMQFRRGTTGGATYTLAAKDSSVNINTAGYIVEEGVTVKSSLTGKAGDEWRIVGENARMEGTGDEDLKYAIYGGVFEITGSGDNYAHLNLGVGITVLLNREGDAQAAQDVQINTGATVILGSSTQIGGNLEFGNMGGILDLNGHDFQRNNDTLYTFDEDARIVNFHASNHVEYSHTLNTSELELITAGFFDAASAGDPTLLGELSLSFTGEVAGASAWLRNNISIAGTLELDNASVTLSGYNVEIANFEVVPNNAEYKPTTDPTKWVRTAVTTSDMTVSNNSHLIIGSHVDVNTPSVTVDASSALTIERYGALNSDVDMRGQASFETLSEYTGHLTLHSDASLTTEGVVDTAFTLSALAGSSTQFNGAVTLADGSSNAGTMNSNSTLTLEGAFTNMGLLHLNGELVLTESFSNTGTLSFGQDFLLNLNSLTATSSGANTLTYTIFTDSESAAFDTLSSNNILLQNSDGYLWDFFSDGTVVGTMLTNTLVYHGGQLNLSVGATGFESGTFANLDSIDFKTADSTLVVTEAGLQAKRLVIAEGVDLTIQSSGGHSISTDRILLETGSSITITGESLAASNVVGLATGALDTTVILDMDGQAISNKSWLNSYDQALALRGGSYDHGNLAVNFSSIDIAADASLKVAGVVLEDFSILLTGSGALQVNDVETLRISQAVNYHGVLTTDASVIHFDNITGAGVALNADQDLYLHVAGDYTGAMSGAGDMFVQLADTTLSNLTDFTGSLYIQDENVTITSSATLTAMEFKKGKTIEIAAGGHTVSVSADTTYTREIGNDTIIVGAGSTLDENIYLRAVSDTLTVSGGGTYEITKFLGADNYAGKTVVNILADTTLRVTHDATASSASAGAGFTLTHWGGGDATTVVNVSGTLDINSGISNQGGIGTINLAQDASLILRKGLYALDGGNTPGAITINAATGSTIQLYDQQADTVDGILVADIAGGANLQAMSATTTIGNGLRLSGTGTVNLTATQANATVNVNGAITAAEGSSTGLTITGTSGQTFNINGTSSYAGDTSITDVNVTAGNAAAFGTTGTVTMTNGSLDLRGHAVSNNINVTNTNLAGFNTYAGSLSIEGDITGTDMGGSISISDTASLTMDGSWFYSAAIANEGSIFLDSDLTLNLANASFSYVDGRYELTLMTGTGSLDASTWLLSAGEVDTTKLSGIILLARDFSYDAGVLSYTTTANSLVWGGGNGTWDEVASNTPWLNDGAASAFASNDFVHFGASSSAENTLTLVGELAPVQITVNSAQNYSFIGTGSLTGATELIKDGTGTLTIATVNSYTGGTTLNAGTLRIQNMNALGSGQLEINDATLALYGGNDVTIDAQDIILNSDTLNITLESTNATLSNAISFGTHALNVSGSGTFTHDKWSSIDTINVEGDATVFFNETNIGTNVYKFITGDGRISVAHTANFHRNTFLGVQFDANNAFSGTFELGNSGKAIIDIDHSNAASRLGLVLGASSQLVLTSGSTTTLFLDSLSGTGQIQFDWSPTVTRHIDLEISSDQEFAGKILYKGDDREGNLTVGSAGEAHHTFTLSGTGTTYSDIRPDKGNLIIENATVALIKGAAWNGVIQLTIKESVLDFSGNATIRSTAAGAINGIGSVHVNAATTLNGANGYSGETVIGNGATLIVGEVGALGTSSVKLNSGTLNLSGHAVSNNITAAGGSLAGLSTYAGTLSVTGSVSVADTITGNISITADGNLNLSGTWAYSQAMSNEGTLSFGSSFTLDLSDASLSHFTNGYSIELFSGTGTLDMSSWLTGGEIDASRITGVTFTDGYSFSYDAGTLSYTMGDIHIAAAENKPLTGSIVQDVIFDSPTGVAVLENGFAQGTGSSFSGEGNIQISDNASVTLDKASADFSGTTSVGTGSTLTVAGKDALGDSQIETSTGASLIIEEGQSIENAAKLAAGASIQAGVLTVTGQAGGAGTVGEGIVSHTETGEGRITGNLMSSVDISLAANGVGKISNSSLSSTTVMIGTASDLTIEGGTMGEDAQFIVVDGARLRFDGTHFSSLKENTFSVVTRSSVSLEDIITVSNSSVDVAITAAPEQVTLDGNLINLYKLDGVEFVLNQTTIENQLFLEINGIDLASLIGRSGFGFSLTGVTELQAGLDFSNLIMSNNGTRISMERMSSYEGNIVLYNAAIPEPSTATLSLLALAGLLARRRRRNS